jgi:Uma2 family endonuclease
MPDGDQYELVDGQLVEVNMGFKAVWLAGRLHHSLTAFCELNKAGWAAQEATYQCFPDAPDKVRKPDVSFIRRGRLPGGKKPEGHCRVKPDIAAEVPSRNDTYYEVREKILEYLAAEIPLVWLVDPIERSVYVYRPDGSCKRLTEKDELTGEDVLPGFRLPVRDLFFDELEENCNHEANGLAE